MFHPRYTWLALLAIWLVFFGWYTSFDGPLTTEEISTILDEAKAKGFPAEGIAKMRRFLESDSGDDFVMVNLIEMNDPPKPMAGVPADATAQELMKRYMQHMWPELLVRASHPVLAGLTTAPALDLWGIEGAEHWTSVGMMRYRSRRDLLDIAKKPDFRGPHEFKVAALNKTIAVPVDPWLQAGDPRFILGLLLIILGQANSLRWLKRSMG